MLPRHMLCICVFVYLYFCICMFDTWEYHFWHPWTIFFSKICHMLGPSGTFPYALFVYLCILSLSLSFSLYLSSPYDRIDDQDDNEDGGRLTLAGLAAELSQPPLHRQFFICVFCLCLCLCLCHHHMIEDIILFSVIYHMRGLTWSWHDL